MTFSPLTKISPSWAILTWLVLIGAPPNEAPSLTGKPIVFPSLEVGERFTISEFDLLTGFTDPEGDLLEIGDFWTDYGSLTFDDVSNTAFLPISSTETLSMEMIYGTYGDYGNYDAGQLISNALSGIVPESLGGKNLDFYYQFNAEANLNANMANNKK